MEKFARKLEEELVTALRKVEVEADNILQKAAGSQHAIQAALAKLRLFIADYAFKDEQAEVTFFKEVKPSFLQQLIYYQEIYFLESRRPLGDREAERKYLINEQRHIQLYFDRYRELYIYYRMDRKDMDHQYFLRSGISTDNPAYLLDQDPQFSTVQSSVLANLMAFERVGQYLSRSLMILDRPEEAGKEFRSTLQWTDPKVSLIELGYALQVAGVFNHGKADIRQIMTVFEIVFNIDLGNYYNAFLRNIRMRKKEPVVLIKKLETSLLGYIDKLIEFPKYS